MDEDRCIEGSSEEVIKQIHEPMTSYFQKGYKINTTEDYAQIIINYGRVICGEKKFKEISQETQDKYRQALLILGNPSDPSKKIIDIEDNDSR